MSIIFWILIIISVVVSLLTSGMIFGVSKFMVSPMVDAVPNLKWTGLSKVLVSLSDLVAQYPLLLLVWPCVILGIGLFVHQNKKVCSTEKCLIISVVITIFSIGFLLGTLFLTMAGSHAMEEQMVLGMGLGV